MTRPRRPSSGRRSLRNTRYFKAKYQRRSGLPVDVAFTVAFGAGLASFLSPCVLPLIPSYVTFITGMTLDDVPRARRVAFVHAVLFVVGFSLIFLALGASATLVGRLLITYRVWISRVGGLLVLAFGLYLLGVFNLGIFARERRIHFTDKPLGYFGTVLVGIAFGAGWTPCIGPILGSILTYAASSADMARGLWLLLAYSLGLAVPFLLSAVAVERFLDFFASMKRQMNWITRTSGVLMIAVGILMVTNYFTILASALQAMTPEALRNRL